MKKSILILLGNIVISIIAIIVILNLGLTNKLAFDDANSSKNSLIITNKGNMQVAEINDINVEDKFIRVINDKLYKDVVFVYEGENFTFDTFTFFSYFDDAAFSVSYEYDVDEIYLDRDFFIIKGYNTISLLMVLISLFQFVYYLAFIASLKKDDFTEYNNIYKYNIFKRIIGFEPLLLTITIIFSTVITYIYQSSQGFNMFVYELTDTQIIYILTLYIIILLLITAYIVAYRQNYKFEFQDDSLNVTFKNKTIFSSYYKDLVVDTVVIKGATAKQGFVKMNLILSSKVPDTSGMNINLKFMEYDDFSSLVERLHALEEKDEIKSVKIRTDEDIVVFARKENNLFLYSSIFFILLVILSLFTRTLFSILNPLQLVLLFSVFVIPYIFLALRAALRKPTEFTFLINKSGIKINDDLIDYDEIKKIKMTKPTLYNTNNKILNIKKLLGSERYMITRSLFKPETQIDTKNYKDLYITIQNNFEDIFN